MADGEGESAGESAPDSSLDNGGTSSQDYRWKWLSTVLAVPLGLSYPALVVSGAATTTVALGAVPQAWWLAYTTGWLVVLAYTYGGDTLSRVADARGGPS